MKTKERVFIQRLIKNTDSRTLMWDILMVADSDPLLVAFEGESLHDYSYALEFKTLPPSLALFKEFVFDISDIPFTELLFGRGLVVIPENLKIQDPVFGKRLISELYKKAKKQIRARRDEARKPPA